MMRLVPTLVIIAKVELPNINIHKLRHFFASQMAAKNINPRTIADWLSHSTVNVTLNIYTHSNLPTLKQAMEIVDNKKASKN